MNRNENLQKEFVDIEVEGGMQVHRFVETLDKKYGLALPMMGNYAGQTVAGVACTSTHGSGCFSGTMVSVILSLLAVTLSSDRSLFRALTETNKAPYKHRVELNYGIEFDVSATVARRLNQLSSQVIEFDELVEPTSR